MGKPSFLKDEIFKILYRGSVRAHSASQRGPEQQQQHFVGLCKTPVVLLHSGFTNQKLSQSGGLAVCFNQLSR